MGKETKIIYWILAVFMAYLIIELIRKLLGGSLGFEELVVGLLIANLGYSFYLRETISKLDSTVASHLSWHRAKDSEKESMQTESDIRQ